MFKNEASGFTIIELLIVVAIIGVLVVVAAPNVSTFLQKKKVSSQVQVINSALSLARVESVTRLQDVKVCWNDTAADIDVDGFAIIPGSLGVIFPSVGAIPAELIRNIQYADATIYVEDDDNDNCVGFNSEGRLIDVTGSTVRFSVCLASGEVTNSQNVSVRASGRAITTENATDSNCS